MNILKTLLIVLFCASLTACGSAEDRKAEYFKKAEQYFEQGDYDKARLEYKNVLQIDPEYLEGHYKLGLVMEALKEWRAAAGHYTKVLELDPTHVDARIKMGQFYLLAKSPDKALEEVSIALEHNPESADAFAFLGTIKAQQSDVQAARFNAQKALSIEPYNVNGLSLMASILVREGKPDEAIELLDEGIKNNPEETRLKTIVAGIYASQDNIAAAAEVIDGLIEFEPGIIAHRIRLAALYSSAKEFDKTEAVLRKAINDLPDNDQAKLLLVRFLAENRDQETAKQELIKLVKADPENYKLKFTLARVYESEADSEKAIEIYQAIIDKEELKPNGLKARTQIAGLYARIREIDKAKTLLDEVLAESPSDQEALALHGKIALSEGEPITAIADFRSAMRDQPNSIPLHRLLARAHAENNEMNLARDTLKRAIDLAPKDMPLREDYIRVLAAEDNISAVIKELDNVLEMEPENLGAMQALFRVMASQEKWKKASRIVNQIKKAHPDKPIGYHYAGLLKQAQREIEASIPEFEKAIELAPDAIQPLTQLVKSYLAMQKPELALKKLKEIVTSNGENFVAYNLLGEVQLFQEDRKTAWESFNKAIEINPKWALPYRNKANLYLINNQDDQAETVYKKGIKNTESSIVLVTELAKLYENKGEYDKAIGLYEEVLIKEEENILAANNLAMLLMNYRGDADSLKRAGILVEELKGENSAAYLDTIGWLFYKQDKLEDSIRYLKRAVDLAPKAAELRYHLGMAYLKSGDNSAAKTELLAAIETENEYYGFEEAKAALKDL